MNKLIQNINQKKQNNSSIEKGSQIRNKNLVSFADNRESNMAQRKLKTIINKGSKQAAQRFVVRVGYDGTLATSENDAVANSQKTVKDTADKLVSIDKDTVNSTKMHDYPAIALTARDSSSTAKTPIAVIGHGAPGGNISGIDMTTLAGNTIDAVKAKSQEIESVKIYSCYSANAEDTTPSSVSKFKSKLASEQMTTVPVYGAKGLLIPGAADTTANTIDVNVIPRRYSSGAFGKKIAGGYFKEKMEAAMIAQTDGTWNAPKGEAKAVINHIVPLISKPFNVSGIFLLRKALAALPPQKLVESGDTSTSSIDYEAAPSGEATAGDKLGAAAKGAKLMLDTLNTDISSMPALSSVAGQIGTKKGAVDTANAELTTETNNTDFKQGKVKDILT